MEPMFMVLGDKVYHLIESDAETLLEHLTVPVAEIVHEPPKVDRQYHDPKFTIPAYPRARASDIHTTYSARLDAMLRAYRHPGKPELWCEGASSHPGCPMWLAQQGFRWMTKNSGSTEKPYVNGWIIWPEDR